MSEKINSISSDVLRTQQGFSLIEMLVTVLIFVVVIIAVYGLFDQGQWYYLHSTKRINAQDNARMAMEQLERDLRMSGFGVPTRAEFGGSMLWTPAIFLSTTSKIYFRGDIDNRNSRLKIDTTAGAMEISIENPTVVCPTPMSSLILLVENNRRWQSLTCMDVNNPVGTIDVDDGAGGGAVQCNNADCEIHTPEHVFYRLSGDADDDGDCDNTAVTNYPFCNLERAVISGFTQNTPTTTVPADDQFQVLATNIVAFRITAGSPMSVTLTARERSRQAGVFQDITLVSQILVRGDVY